ncbi:MAG TPA: FCD domain-containing protein [Actinomycetota bacterium]|nr:FCD domain-containing protein [Actinomycetota bacterium]
MNDRDSELLPPHVEALLEDVFFRQAHWHSAYEVAVQRLAQAIKLGALKSGARLPPERELVERLGVSRTTLREGIRALQQQGYLKTSRGRSGGTFIVQRRIRQPTRTDIQRIAREMGPLIPELFDMRAAVEPKAAELAALRATDEAIENLRWLAERAERVPAAELRQADSTLHIAIAHTARSARLLDLVLEEQMRLHELLAYLSSARGLRGEQDHSEVQHHRIVDAIADRDPETSYRAMRDHIEATNALLSDVLKVDLGMQRAPAG